MNPATVGTFPKAVLGLPTVFHFKDSPRGENPNPDFDPVDVTLYPDISRPGSPDCEFDRMASPVILRPVFVPKQGWTPGVLVLPCEHLKTLCCRLTSSRATFLPGKDRIPNSMIRGTSVADVLPLKKYSCDDALMAFLKFIKANGFTERAAS